MPAAPETWVRSLGQEKPLEEEVATHSTVLTWKTPWTEEPGGLCSMGSQELDTTLHPSHNHVWRWEPGSPVPGQAQASPSWESTVSEPWSPSEASLAVPCSQDESPRLTEAPVLVSRSVNELYVDDPDKDSGGKIDVSLNISLPNLHCECEYSQQPSALQDATCGQCCVCRNGEIG